MIHPPPSFTASCLLLVLLAGPTVARAEPEGADHHPAATAPEHTPAPIAEPLTTAGHSAHSPPEPEAKPTVEHTPAAEPPAEHPATPAPSAAAAQTEHPAPPQSGGHGPAAVPGPDPKEVHRQIAGLQKLGVSLTDRGDWDAAEIAFRQILAKRQSDATELANALIGLARVYRRQGSLTKAAAIYERFLSDYPTNDQVPDALLELGRTHRALGASQLALARFYSVINSTLKVSGEGFIHYQMLAKTAQFEIAETHFQLGNFAEANKFFSRLRLLDLAPADRARAHFKSAYALYLGQDYENAVTTLNSYLEQWPQDENIPEARNLLALSLRSLGRKAEALDATLQLLRSEQGAADPKRWAYWQRRTGNQLANDFFQNGDTLNALAIYQGLTALAPEPAWRLPVTYQMALCYERMRDAPRATAAYQDIIDTTARLTETAPELTELARMARWRIGQLAWQTSTDTQLADLFSHVAPVAPATVATAPTSPTPKTSTPANDHSGNPAKTPSSL